MIDSKERLREYILADESRYKLRRPRLLGWLLNSESWYVLNYLHVLRHLEYYTNCRRGVFSKLAWVYYQLRWRRLSRRYGMMISPNVVGKGVYIPHIFAGGVIINALRVGDYCIFNTGVVIGNKSQPDCKPVIGNHVEVTLGSKVIGRVTLGDHCIVAPNSVVVKDVPPYAVVSGVPARIIKMNKDND